MSQAVENKAYEMVEEMMMEREMDVIDSDELTYWVTYQICWIKIIVPYSTLSNVLMKIFWENIFDLTLKSLDMPDQWAIFIPFFL